MQSKLSTKHQEFIREYFLCKRNASEAYRRVYPKCKTPHVNAAQLLAKPNISAAIEAKEKELQAKYEITEERIMQRLAQIAFGDLADLLEWDASSVSLKSSKELTPDNRARLHNVEQGVTEGGDFFLKWKLHDQTKALELLGKQIGMWKDGSRPTDSGDKQAILQRVSQYLRRNQG